MMEDAAGTKEPVQVVDEGFTILWGGLDPIAEYVSYFLALPHPKATPIANRYYFAASSSSTASEATRRRRGTSGDT
jgi:hypothetical protein